MRLRTLSDLIESLDGGEVRRIIDRNKSGFHMVTIEKQDPRPHGAG